MPGVLRAMFTVQAHTGTLLSACHSVAVHHAVWMVHALHPIHFDFLNGEPRDINFTVTDKSGTSETVISRKNGAACPRTEEVKAHLVRMECHTTGLSAHAMCVPVEL